MKNYLLLIDDDEDEELIFCDALLQLKVNYKCAYAKNAGSAVKMLGTVVPEMIFVDYNMPCIDGLDTIKLIRNLTCLRRIPIILYSTHIDDVTRKRAEINGAFACIDKPNTFTGIKSLLFDFIGLLQTV